MLWIRCPRCTVQFAAEPPAGVKRVRCPKCGWAVPAPASADPVEADVSASRADGEPADELPAAANGSATAGLVLGALALVLALMPGGWRALAAVVAIPGLALSVVGLLVSRTRGAGALKALIGLLLALAAMYWVPLALWQLYETHRGWLAR